MSPGNQPEAGRRDIQRIWPCRSCQTVARAILGAACAFGASVEANGDNAELVCADHLPLVVGYTAPRHLARWLAACLDPAPHSTAVCSLCRASNLAAATLSGKPTDDFSCASHGGTNGSGPATVRRALLGIATGERLTESDERRLLRTALVLFASVRGTSVFVSRLE
jgi:hypothetical protein